MNELEQDGNKMAKNLLDIMRKVIRKQKIKNIFNEKDYRTGTK
jgi:hypothetical protein